MDFLPDLLTPGERRRMLADIACVALAIGQDLYPEQSLNDLDISPGSEAGSNEICPQERLAFIAALWPRLAGALVRLEAEPLAALRVASREVPVEKARRVRATDLLTSLRGARGGEMVPVPEENSPLARRLGGRLPRRVREQATLPDADTPANRLVKLVLATFARELKEIAALAQISGRLEVASRAFALRRGIGGALRRPPWNGLPLTPAVTLLPGLRNHGGYRLFSDAWRRYRHRFTFDWSNPLFTLPARESWLLYEYWCLFQTAAVLRSLGCQTVSADGFTLLRSGLTFRLARGKAARLRFTGPVSGGETVELTYNREFPELNPAAIPSLHSISHAMRPDITLQVGERLLVLDAKYKAYQPLDSAGKMMDMTENLPLTADVNQMHAYRDGIRRGDGKPAVVGAWLLYTGGRWGENLPVVAYPAPVSDAPLGRGEIGALLLRPMGNRRWLEELIKRFLSEG